MGSILEPNTFCIPYTRNVYLAKKEKKNSLWHSSKARISCIKPAYPILHYVKLVAYLGCVLGYTHLIFLLMCLPTFLFMSPYIKYLHRAAVQKESKARLPAAVRENEPASTRDSLSWGGIKIELGRAVEIDLKEITASGGSRNILQLFLSQKKLTV